MRASKSWRLLVNAAKEVITMNTIVKRPVVVPIMRFTGRVPRISPRQLPKAGYEETLEISTIDARRCLRDRTVNVTSADVSHRVS